jgi:hypothetical protein
VLTHFWTTGEPGKFFSSFIRSDDHGNSCLYFSLAIDLSTFSYYIDGESVPSIQFLAYMVTGAGFNDQTSPWGTKWMGKGAKGGAWYNNL